MLRSLVIVVAVMCAQNAQAQTTPESRAQDLPPYYFALGGFGSVNVPGQFAPNANVGGGGGMRMGLEVRRGRIGLVVPEIAIDGGQWTLNVSSTTPDTITVVALRLGLRVEAKPWAADWQPWISAHGGASLESIGGAACRIVGVSDECRFISGATFDFGVGWNYLLTEHIAVGPFVEFTEFFRESRNDTWVSAGLAIDFAIFSRQILIP